MIQKPLDLQKNLTMKAIIFIQTIDEEDLSIDKASP